MKVILIIPIGKPDKDAIRSISDAISGMFHIQVARGILMNIIGKLVTGGSLIAGIHESLPRRIQPETIQQHPVFIRIRENDRLARIRFSTMERLEDCLKTYVWRV